MFCFFFYILFLFFARLRDFFSRRGDEKNREFPLWAKCHDKSKRRAARNNSDNAHQLHYPQRNEANAAISFVQVAVTARNSDVATRPLATSSMAGPHLSAAGAPARRGCGCARTGMSARCNARPLHGRGTHATPGGRVLSACAHAASTRDSKSGGSTTPARARKPTRASGVAPIAPASSPRARSTGRSSHSRSNSPVVCTAPNDREHARDRRER